MRFETAGRRGQTWDEVAPPIFFFSFCTRFCSSASEALRDTWMRVVIFTVLSDHTNKMQWRGCTLLALLVFHRVPGRMVVTLESSAVLTFSIYFLVLQTLFFFWILWEHFPHAHIIWRRRSHHRRKTENSSQRCCSVIFTLYTIQTCACPYNEVA